MKRTVDDLRRLVSRTSTIDSKTPKSSALFEIDEEEKSNESVQDEKPVKTLTFA